MGVEFDRNISSEMYRGLAEIFIEHQKIFLDGIKGTEINLGMFISSFFEFLKGKHEDFAKSLDVNERPELFNEIFKRK